MRQPESRFDVRLGGGASYRPARASPRRRRDRRALHLTLIAILAAGVFGSSAWLIFYDTTSGRIAMPAKLNPPPELPLRDHEADVRRVRHTIGAEGFLAGVLARYQLRAGQYPVRLQDLLERPAELDPSIYWDGPYVSDPEMLDDAWDQPYEYVHPGVHNPEGYDLWSVGPDGVSGTADDIGNW